MRREGVEGALLGVPHLQVIPQYVIAHSALTRLPEKREPHRRMGRWSFRNDAMPMDPNEV